MKKFIDCLIESAFIAGVIILLMVLYIALYDAAESLFR